MSFSVTCPNCKASFRVKDEWAGKKGKCPQCKAVLEVPEVGRSTPGAQPGAAGKPVEAGVPATVSRRVDETRHLTVKKAPPPPSDASAQQKARSPAQWAQEILSAFRGEIEPAEVSAAYRFGILLVAVVMVLLPLVYVALIGVAGYLIYWHATHNTFLLGMGRGRARGLAVMAYVGPLAAGAILLLFMIKPLFARPAKEYKKRSLAREGEGLLFAFVDRICAAVGAPAPRRIDVDCQVNASASFRRGLLSMLGSDLVLTIGLPLVAGLNLRQFAGVLAHEFGHFTQGAGMRLTYVIRSVSWWFTRVVYERDVWDERLVRWAENQEGHLSWIFQLARLFVWLTRRILWVLMMIGHAVSGFMLRQMEFDADRYEARLGGSDTFEATARQLMVLNVANQGALADLGEFFKEGRLGDNLPQLVEVNAARMPAELHAKLNQAIAESRTGLLDTHPADKDRIASAQRENAPGIFRLEHPATVLFGDFGRLCREVTGDFYRETLGPAFDRSQVRPTDELLARQGKELEADKALGRYFQGMFHVLRPLPLPAGELEVPAQPKQSAAQVKEARQRMLAAKPDYDKAYAAYEQADVRIVEAGQATAMLRAELKVKPADFSLGSATVEACNSARETATAQQVQVELQLADAEQAAAERLFAALELLAVPQVAAKVPGADRQVKESERMLEAARAVGRQVGPLLELRNEHAALGCLLGNLEDNQQNQALIRSLHSRMESLLGHVRGIREALYRIPYPFDHAKGDVSIGEYLVPEMPHGEDWGAVVDAGAAILETLPALYARMVGRLVLTAEKVEQVLGLPRLEEPKPTGA